MSDQPTVPSGQPHSAHPDYPSQGHPHMESAAPNMGYAPEANGGTAHGGQVPPPTQQAYPPYYCTPGTNGVPHTEPPASPYANAQAPHGYAVHPHHTHPPHHPHYGYAQPQYAPPTQPPHHGYPPPPYAPPPAYAYHHPPHPHQPPYAQHPLHSHDAHHHTEHGLASFFNFRDERFVKGAVTGAALTFLLTNESLQKNTIKSVIRFWHLVQGSVEEMKERIQDIDAEIKAEEQAKANK